MDERNDHAPRATYGALLGLAWPIIVSRSTQVVDGLADALMVAHLGESALAATATGAMNTFLLVIFPMGICFIVSSFSAQLTGRGDALGARRFGFYGLLVALVAGVLGIASIPLVPAVLDRFDYSPEVGRLMTDYIQVRLFSIGMIVGAEALANYYGGIGNTRRQMVANLSSMVVNIVANWLLIDGHLGLPALGVAGAAWSSVLANGVAFFGLLAVFLYEGKALGRIVPKLAGRELWRMLRFGVPSGVNWFFEFLAFSFFVNVVVTGLGTSALAAMNAVLQLNSVAFMPAFGMATAGSILVGQMIGADQKDRVAELVKMTFFVTVTWQTLAALAYLLIPRLLFQPFLGGHDADELLAVGVRMLMLSAAWQLFDATATVIGEALRAAGDTAVVMWARVVIAWIFFAPGSYLTVTMWGGGDLLAIGWMVAYLALLAIFLFFRFRSNAWKKLELVEPSVEPTA
jgi:multidrug resistance protein, MATE family